MVRARKAVREDFLSIWDPLSQTTAPATKRQQSLIDTVLKRIPDAIHYPEYQEYIAAGTKGAANEFLNSVLKQEEDAEKIGKLVTYMAERPGVVSLSDIIRTRLSRRLIVPGLLLLIDGRQPICFAKASLSQPSIPLRS